MKPEGKAEVGHLNAATQRFTQKTGLNSEGRQEGENNVFFTRAIQTACVFVCWFLRDNQRDTNPLFYLQVDFYTDMDEDSDIAFRFRVHFGNHVVMNRREFGIWMLEETTDYVPFEDGKQFELCIYVHYNEYEIKVNGIRIYGFVHRIPPSFVKMVQVSRDISLTSVCVCN
eukprot:XP_016882204.1 galactoside-binding soluble lectin 13 isoform X1 [Homo sapiens]